MLNKVKVAAIAQAVVVFIRLLAPDLELPEGFERAVEVTVELLVALLTVFLMWKVRETPKTVAKLALKKGRLP